MNQPINEIYGHDTDLLPPPPEDRKTDEVPLDDLHEDIFRNRVVDLCLTKRRNIVDLVLHPEFKEATRDVIEAIGKQKAEEVMSGFFVEYKGLFK